MQKNALKISIVSVLLFILLYLLLPNQRQSHDYVKLLESSGQMVNEASDESKIDQAQIIPATSESEEEELEKVVYVDIKGAVMNPDMYMLPLGSRVYDAIELAGGLRSDAATEYLNQAKLLEDQMMIYIQTYDEVEESGAENINSENYNNAGIIEEAQPDGTAAAAFVNINTASLEELMTLPNIGPKKAEAIIQFRQEHGSFTMIEDIMGVSGIGVKTFENLQELITVTP